MTTRTVAVFPVVAALAKAAEVGNALAPWNPVNEQQEKWLVNADKWQAQAKGFSPEELKTIASFKAEEINTWLKEGGYDIALEPFSDPDDFGTASIMTVAVKWITAGERTFVANDGKDYDAAELTSDVTITQSEGYEHPVAHIHCENGDTVHMTVADRTDLEQLDLLNKVVALTAGKRSFKYGGVVFPMVEHNAEVDISFFEGMNFKGRRRSGGIDTCKVKEAKQQTKFKMNHLGAKAESAVAVSMTFECCFVSKPNLVIDKEFYVWMTRPGMDTPYFAACVSKSDWKDPGDVS